jgi:hypothetical protein
MRSLFSNSVVAIAGLLIGCTLVACSDGGDEGLIITKNVAAQPIVGGCTFTGDQSEPFIAHGFVDVHAPGYLMHPQFVSRIVADVADDPTALTQRTIILTDADIDITFPDSTTESFAADDPLVHFKELVSAPVAPNGGSTDTEIEVIHRDLIEKVAADQGGGSNLSVEMEVSMVAHGTMSGATIDSQKFVFPVALVSGTASPIQALGTCPLPMGTILSETGNPCNAFQDSPVQCCTNTDNSLMCPADISAQ